MPKGLLISRRGFVVALVAIALTTSLATRVFHGSFGSKVEVSSTSVYQKVQHRDKDAAEWVPASTELCLLWLTEVSLCAEQDDSVHARPHYNSLYNRPPPLASALENPMA